MSMENRCWNLEPLGERITREIERSPLLANVMLSVGRERLGGAIRELAELEDMVNRGEPLESCVQKSMDVFVLIQRAALDLVFDPTSYSHSIGKRTDRRKYLDDTIRTIMPSNGTDNHHSFKLRVLLHLANVFGKKSSDPKSYSFEGYDFDWHRKNYICPGDRTKVFQITDESLRDETERFLRSTGIKNGDFDAIYEELKSLHREAMERRESRRRAVDKLLENTVKEQDVVRALTDFSGRVLSLSEEPHIIDRRGINLLLIAADNAGEKREQIKGMLFEKVME